VCLRRFLSVPENLVRYVGKSATSLADKASNLRAVKGFSIAGNIVSGIGIAATLFEDYNREQGLTKGTGVKLLIAGAGVIFPGFGLAYGLVDITVGLATGKNLTDRIGDAVDSF